MVPIPEAEAKVTETKVEDGKLNPITRQFFLEHIFDYRKGNDFVYNGDKPVVIDFWATWCGPCMRLLPEMEKLAEKYKGKVIFYKVNADKEKDLCSHFSVQAFTYVILHPGRRQTDNRGWCYAGKVCANHRRATTEIKILS